MERTSAGRLVSTIASGVALGVMLNVLTTVLTTGVSLAAETSDKGDQGPRGPREVAPEGVTDSSRRGATGTSAEDAREKVAVEEEGTSAAGEKSYQFQAIEVEGRLKAPQILYFLRRVRAELRAGRLGHRSFLPELQDTRRSGALR